MKIKRYFAPDIREAIRMVREEQGPDAVILSNRKVDGGVEIVAARDFDEQALLDRGKPESRAPATPAEEEPAARTDEARRRAEDVFREALGKFAPEPAPAPRKPEPAPRRAEPAPAAPAAKDYPSRSEPIGYREPNPNLNAPRARETMSRGSLLDEIERAEQPAPRRPERPAAEARPAAQPPR